MSQNYYEYEAEAAAQSLADTYRDLQVAALQDIARRFEEADDLVDILGVNSSQRRSAEPPAAAVDPKPHEAEIIPLPLDRIAKRRALDEQANEEPQIEPVSIEPSCKTSAGEPLFAVRVIEPGRYHCQLGVVSHHVPVREGAGRRTPHGMKLSVQEKIRSTKRGYGREQARVKPCRACRLVSLVRV